MTHWTDNLKRLNACSDAVHWAASYDTLQAAWDACKRGDWMLWLWGRCVGEPWSDSRRPLVLCCCECARLALPHAKGEQALAAIECTEAWTRGEHNDRQKLLAAANAAADAAYAAYAAYAAADAAYAAANAAADAAYAAYAAYAAAVAAAVAKQETLRQCADIVRKYKPIAPEVKP